MSTAYIVFEDQLSADPRILRGAERTRDLVVVVDTLYATDENATRRAFRASALRHFYDSLAGQGWRIEVAHLDRREGSGALGRAIKKAIGNHMPKRIVAIEPGDGAMKFKVERLAERFWIPVDILRDHRFICARCDFLELSEGDDDIDLMRFYREIRSRHRLLMISGRPAGGSWRFGADLHDRVAALSDPAPVPVIDGEAQTLSVTQFEADRALDRFAEFTLPALERPCDGSGMVESACAMMALYMEAGLITPLRLCRIVEERWRAGDLDLDVAEAIVFCIAGEREYRHCLARHNIDAGTISDRMAVA